MGYVSIAKKAIKIGKKAVQTYNTGKNAQAGKHDYSMVHKTPATPKKIAPKTPVVKTPAPVPEKTITIFGSEVKQSSAILGGILLFLASAGIGYSTSKR